MAIPLVTLLCLNCRIFAAVTNKEIRSGSNLRKDGTQLQIFQEISKLGQAEEGEQSLHHPCLHCHGLLLLPLTQVLPGILQGQYIPCLLENIRTAKSQVHVTNKTLYCSTLGLIPYYPKWMHTMSFINHLMLVLNSSINFIIYCLVGSR